MVDTQVPPNKINAAEFYKTLSNDEEYAPNLSNLIAPLLDFANLYYQWPQAKAESTHLYKHNTPATGSLSAHSNHKHTLKNILNTHPQHTILNTPRVYKTSGIA